MYNEAEYVDKNSDRDGIPSVRTMTYSSPANQSGTVHINFAYGRRWELNDDVNFQTSDFESEFQSNPSMWDWHSFEVHYVDTLQ